MRGMSGIALRWRIVVPVMVAVLAAGAVGTALAVTTSGSSHVVSLASGGRTSAALEVTAGTPVLDVTVARLPGTLLRVSTPEDAPVRPVLSGSAPIELSLAGAPAGGAPAGGAPAGGAPAGGAPGGSGHGEYAVRVVLSAAVVWSIDFAGGTQRTEADLRGGKVGGIAVTAGSDILDVSLPRPAGTLPFLLAGGVSQFLLSLPGGVPAQVTVGAGASYVSVDNQDSIGVAGGTVISPPGWATAASRFDIDATSGFSRLTVSRW
jgi:hypothetical protein